MAGRIRQRLWGGKNGDWGLVWLHFDLGKMRFQGPFGVVYRGWILGFEPLRRAFVAPLQGLVLWFWEGLVFRIKVFPGCFGSVPGRRI